MPKPKLKRKTQLPRIAPLKVRDPITIEEIQEGREDLKALFEKRREARKSQDGFSRDRERGNDKGDENFNLCLVFQSFSQKQEFLKAIPQVPCIGTMFVDGQTFARAVGVKIPKNCNKPYHEVVKEKLDRLTLERQYGGKPKIST